MADPPNLLGTLLLVPLHYFHSSFSSPLAGVAYTLFFGFFFGGAVKVLGGGPTGVSTAATVCVFFSSLPSLAAAAAISLRFWGL
jgi:hypothetical protein